MENKMSILAKYNITAATHGGPMEHYEAVFEKAEAKNEIEQIKWILVNEKTGLSLNKNGTFADPSNDWVDTYKTSEMQNMQAQDGARWYIYWLCEYSEMSFEA